MSAHVDWEAVTAAFDTLDTALDLVAAQKVDSCSTREWFAVLERCERVRRRLPAVEHGPINHLARQATAEELGGKLSHTQAEWLLISRGDARRIREAVDLAERRDS